MTTILLIVILGLLFSFAVGTLVGTLIAFGMGSERQGEEDSL
jgi:hypothetical protein